MMTNDDPMPVFALKAKDNLTPHAVLVYASLCRAFGLTEQAEQVWRALAEIEAWRDRHLDQVHLPDHEHVPAGPWDDVRTAATYREALAYRLGVADRLTAQLAAAVRRADGYQEIADAATAALVRSSLNPDEAEQLRRRFEDHRDQPGAL